MIIKRSLRGLNDLLQSTKESPILSPPVVHEVTGTGNPINIKSSPLDTELPYLWDLGKVSYTSPSLSFFTYKRDTVTISTAYFCFQTWKLKCKASVTCHGTQSRSRKSGTQTLPCPLCCRVMCISERRSNAWGHREGFWLKCWKAGLPGKSWRMCQLERRQQGS